MSSHFLLPSPPSPINHFLISNGLSQPKPSFLNFQTRVKISRKIVASWSSASKYEEYGGWGITETKTEENKKGLLRAGVFGGGIGVSVAVVVVAVVCRGLGFQYSSPFSSLQRILMSSRLNAANVNNAVTEEILQNASGETSYVSSSGSVTKLENTIALDSTQKEAVHLLKKLKIIKEDDRVDGLCTRREYARWLIGANTLLERNPKHRILPSISCGQPAFLAFDDVNMEDQDFSEVQALAEAGIVISNISIKNSRFFPERYLSRLELVTWKAMLDYGFTPSKIPRNEIDYVDLKNISSDAPAELYKDMMAGDKSTLRRVFGQSRRLQPDRLATIGQAAVALTSGRMAGAICNEISRLEAENSVRLAEMEEIRNELLSRGVIQKSWEEKLEDVKTHRSEVTRHYNAVLHDLKNEQNLYDKILSENMKEKIALECQKQLLPSLKNKVTSMSERLASERANATAEQLSLEEMSIELSTKQEAITVAKSILEAEKEALRILRSWVEDEARRSLARAKVFEEVGRRWNWVGEAPLS